MLYLPIGVLPFVDRSNVVNTSSVTFAYPPGGGVRRYTLAYTGDRQNPSTVFGGVPPTSSETGELKFPIDVIVIM
jgi:hypothetical protein